MGNCDGVSGMKVVLIVIGVLLSRSDGRQQEEGEQGKRWAVLVAGSNGYENYRHQADVCHAYQVLRKGGLPDENIIVFMYDDIAFHPNNPAPGIIINKPDGVDVYKGVPKDYTGKHVNAVNFYAAILANQSAAAPGGGVPRKLLDTGPHDHIFIYYTDHGAAGVLGMPEGDYIYVKDLIDVLKRKHEAKSYKSMVIYVEACESGSMFEGLLPENIRIYASTASNATENSWATYCPTKHSSPSTPTPYDTCLGDLYSIAWMEDSDNHDLTKETLNQQYHVVRARTLDHKLGRGSHVMLYGNKSIGNNFLNTYIGNNNNYTSKLRLSASLSSSSASDTVTVSQRDATLIHYWYKFQNAPSGSTKKMEARKQLDDEILNRRHADYTINHIGQLLFGHARSSQVLNNVRHHGQSLVDDWECFTNSVKTYEKHCKRLSSYGMKYTRALANICNAGITINQIEQACLQTCLAKT